MKYPPLNQISNCSFSQRLIAVLGCVSLFTVLKVISSLLIPIKCIYSPISLTLIAVASSSFIYIVKFGKAPNKLFVFYNLITFLIAFTILPLMINGLLHHVVASLLLFYL